MPEPLGARPAPGPAGPPGRGPRLAGLGHVFLDPPAAVAAHLALEQVFLVRVGVVVVCVRSWFTPVGGSGRPGRLGSASLNRCGGAGPAAGLRCLPGSAGDRGRPGRARAMLRCPGRLCPEGPGRATETMFCPDSVQGRTRTDSGPVAVTGRVGGGRWPLARLIGSLGDAGPGDPPRGMGRARRGGRRRRPAGPGRQRLVRRGAARRRGRDHRRRRVQYPGPVLPARRRRASPSCWRTGSASGHRATVHGAHVGAGALIGIGAIVLGGARIGAGSLVAAGAVVLPGREFPAGRAGRRGARPGGPGAHRR